MKKPIPTASPDAYFASLDGLKPGGKYEMATLELHENMTVVSAMVRSLTREAVALNAAFS